jgi:uncharacterized phage-associated protein
MNAYYKAKLNAAIAWFAKKHFEKTGKYLTQHGLFKYLAFFEFQSVKERGIPVFGLKYVAMKWGPVPQELYQEFKKSHSLQTELYQVKRIKEQNREVVLILPSSKEADTNLFSPRELQVMKDLVEIYGDRWIDTKIFSEASHQGIKAWQKAYQKKPNSVIRFEDEIEGSDLPEEKKQIYLERLATFEELTAL